jgi:uncharacterized protein YjbI with pentapeptide repeats
MEEIVIQELFKRYEAGERDFRHKKIVQPSGNLNLIVTRRELMGKTLSASDFRDSDLTILCRFLTGVNLSKTNLQGLDLKLANFERCNLTEANLSGCYLWRAIFDRANLKYANLSDTDLEEASFFKANLRDVNLSNAKTQQTYFGKANLTSANLDNLNFSGIYFINTVMPDRSICTRSN